ncbi:PucR family transcriptional regulator [Nocardia sp. NPDC052566]|uniref:PucR family transcriptional regulator n=1 Tax=Nocardia sp. NPDC052566 TaxID=3364330 RepID=UPI0037C57E98
MSDTSEIYPKYHRIIPSLRNDLYYHKVADTPGYALVSTLLTCQKRAIAIIPCMPLPLTPLRMDSPLMQNVLARLSSLAQQTVSTSIHEVDVYSQLSEELVGNELKQSALTHFSAFLTVADQGREARRDDLTEVIASVSRRAEERIPLGDVVDAYLTGARVVSDAVTAAAGPDDIGDLRAFTSNLLAYLHRATVEITSTYLEVHRGLLGVEREAREALSTALLMGKNAAGLAAQANISLADSYDVVIVDVDGVPARPTNAGELASARRRIRQTQDVANRYIGAGKTLLAFDGKHGALLVPAPAQEPLISATLGDLVQALTADFALPVTAAVAHADSIAAIPATVTLAGDVLELVLSIGHEPGLYRLDDVLVEYQITRPGPARDALEALIDPLHDHPHLLEALHANLLHGMDRKAASSSLHIHPNSYSYRLRRIAELTGLDATDIVDARVLSAAVLATSLRRNGRG